MNICYVNVNFFHKLNLSDEYETILYTTFAMFRYFTNMHWVALICVWCVLPPLRHWFYLVLSAMPTLTRTTWRMWQRTWRQLESAN